MIIVVCGVTGSGTSTVGRLLAERLGYMFRDAKAFIDEGTAPADDIELFSRLAKELPQWSAQGGVVLACPAITERSRERLRGDGLFQAQFIYLDADKETVIERRGTSEPDCRAAIDRDFALLEVPEDAIALSARQSVKEIVDQACAILCAGKRILLLTGPPGVGKTTIMRQVIESLDSDEQRIGFLTEEMRCDGQRTGFRIRSLDGEEEILAHVDFETRHRVSQYSVDVHALERVIRRSLRPPAKETPVFIDEIGKMECFSRTFVEMIEQFIEDGRPIIATVAQRGPGFVARIKRHPAAEIWTVTADSRADLPTRILDWLRQKNQPDR